MFVIETTYDFLLYTESIIALLMPLLTTIQLFDDVLLSLPIIITMISLVADVMIANLM